MIILMGVLMDIDRAKRYKEKINRASRRADQISEWALSNSNLDFAEDEKTQLATYKAFQEITEACLDIVAMIEKNRAQTPVFRPEQARALSIYSMQSNNQVWKCGLPDIVSIV